jgi:hypothetical protein
VIATDIVGDEVAQRHPYRHVGLFHSVVPASQLLVYYQYHWIGAQEKPTHGHITPDMFMCMMEHAYDLTID